MFSSIKSKKLVAAIKKEKPISELKYKKRVQITLPKVKVEKVNAPKLCDLCGMTFNSLDRLAIHKRKVHFKKPVKCSECPRILSSNYYLNRHIRRCHKREDNFICSSCGRGFTFKGEMMTHIKNVHNKHLKPKKMFSCDLCDKVFKCNKSVVIHVRSVHTGKVELFYVKLPNIRYFCLVAYHLILLNQYY